MTTLTATTSTPLLLRSMRVVTGLYLLAYVTSHLLNVSLGLVSLEMMERARPFLSGVWMGPVTSIILIGALLIHYVLGLWATYQRASLTATSQDLIQAVSGLVIIPLLATHALGVRGLKDGNVEVTYELINRIFWLSNPGIGLIQVLLVSVVWVHGCAGFFLWLRSKPGVVNILPWLYPLAVAIPVIALLGFTQAGRIVLIEGLGPVIEQQPLADGSAPPSIDYAGIKARTNGMIWLSIALGALVLIARQLRSWLARPAQVRVTTDGVGALSADTGQSLLDGLRAGDQPHANLCAGRGRCGTCAVRVIASDLPLPPPSPLEQATLSRFEHGADIRLACQLPLEPGSHLQIARVHPPDFTFDRDPAPRPTKTEVAS